MPTPSKSVQFQSVEAVIVAYQNREVPAFAIYCGKQFLFKFEGDKMEDGESALREMLELLQANESSAIYTLCVYEDLKGKIKDNTPYDGSFNFRFAQHAVGYLPGVAGGVNGLHSQIAALQLEVKKLQEKEKEEDEPESELGIVGEILALPAVEPLVPIIAGRLVDILFPEAPAKTSRVAGIHFSVESVTDDEKVRESLKKLGEDLPEMPELLFKLALLKQKKPMQFKIYLNMLLSMKL